MFVTAIEVADRFTRPIHLLLRYFGSIDGHPGTATLVLVNDAGWALTCKHVAQFLREKDAIAARYASYRKDVASLRGQKNERRLAREAEKRHGYSKKDLIEVLVSFKGCPNPSQKINVIEHPTYDLALLQFVGFAQIPCDRYPIFAKNGPELKQGKMICRMGFPFPEFSNFAYNAANDQFEWTDQGRELTPRFPIDGMVTRHIWDTQGKTVGFELTTPGLRGQSGGPAFDRDGIVWGIQSQTRHLDLDFDVNMKVFRGGTTKEIHESAVLHVGLCVHVDVLKEFMSQHGVAFQVG